MNKLNAVLLGTVLSLTILTVGCDPKAAAASSGIEIVSIKLDDWTNPKDGKVYVVALPTWKNNGKEDVRQVTFMAAIKGEEATQPKNDLSEPQFYGGVVEPGTTVEPKRVPEDGVVIGEKETFKELTADSVEISAIASGTDYVPPKKSDV
ncbi:MAG: hypothetical protein H7Y17_15610 [Chlorobia bacterium]|nr:hypothetical protein [Fimbriimonadaceae bacterium]